MFKFNLIFLVSIILLNSCNNNSRKSRREEKNAAVADFKTKIIIRIDSSNRVFAKAFKLLDSGIKPDSVKKIVKPTLSELQHQIDSISRNFAIIGEKFRLDSVQYEGTFEELSQYGTYMFESNKKLKAKGIDISK